MGSHTVRHAMIHCTQGLQHTIAALCTGCPCVQVASKMVMDTVCCVICKYLCTGVPMYRWSLCKGGPCVQVVPVYRCPYIQVSLCTGGLCVQVSLCTGGLLCVVHKGSSHT